MVDMEQLFEVKFADEKSISRETCCQNEILLTIALKHLGTRVCVNALEFHIASLYELMTISIPSAFHGLITNLSF